MADGKWVSGLTRGLPADEAAKAVLSARLAAVRKALPAAAHEPDDPEAVHQLRVTTRRAAAAVRIFRDFLPGRRRREARRVLRSLRRAAGDARDWDVFLDFLLDGEAGPATDFLSGYAFGQRDAAQVVLAGVAAERAADLDDLCETLPSHTKADKPPTLAELGTTELVPLLDGFTAAVAATPSSPADLHRLRIAGKRVRYAMEVFADCYAPPFRDQVYPAVERAQQLLGTIQDGHVGTARLAALRKRLRKARPATAKRIDPGLAALIAELRRRALAEKQAFRVWVKEWKALTAAHPFGALLKAAESQKPRDAGGTGSDSPAGGGRESGERGLKSLGGTSGGSKSRPHV